MANHDLALRIDAVLPQTQCTRCGFAGCRPYADALAAGTSQIDRCPPGGDAVIASLAALTGRAQPEEALKQAAHETRLLLGANGS